MSLFQKHLAGIHIEHHKNTMDKATEKMPLPDKVYISMVQHIGAPCQPVVSVGDHVKACQIIGDSPAPVSAPIHASASGKVVAVEPLMTLMGLWSQTVTIALDKVQESLEGLEPPVIRNREDFIKAVRDSGLVGLGGAAFPTHVKLNPPNPERVDTLVINAAECEPYITADYRTMIETPDLVVGGIKTVMKHLNIPNCVIGIEENKPLAIEIMRDLTADTPEIRVAELENKYPQGAERVLIYETTGRVFPPGKLPADAGVVVLNVSSAAVLEKYFQTGRPLISKRVTVDGNAVRTPKNVMTLIGTSLDDMIAFCDGFKRIPKKILMGGPMMGRAIYDDGKALIKNNNAILAFDEEWAAMPPETPCIHCGRCVRACPLKLMPTSLYKAYNSSDIDELKRLHVSLCMECGCCTYVCPAKKPLSFVNRLGKKLVAEGGK
ncbi:MAG: electron transport complex subunit RsxC [Bacillota bacterium]|nr:electron transport complex subunit RsxC [Bacillota bacterium]